MAFFHAAQLPSELTIFKLYLMRDHARCYSTMMAIVSHFLCLVMESLKIIVVLLANDHAALCSWLGLCGLGYVIVVVADGDTGRVGW